LADRRERLIEQLRDRVPGFARRGELLWYGGAWTEVESLSNEELRGALKLFRMKGPAERAGSWARVQGVPPGVHVDARGRRTNPAGPRGRKINVKFERAGKLPEITVSSPSEAAGAIGKLIGDNLYEQFVVLYLGAQNNVIGYDRYSEGGLATVSVQTSAIVRNALLVGALGVVTVHQHPSGDPTPSQADKELWKKLSRQLHEMDLLPLDNLVVTGAGYYSQSEAHG